ncbi:hypothetical protein KKR91_03090 [Arthrobacter jiangjiafuii]|uniref:Uncharacterized protein n=1 Tax=Arthrobacter jiangjiafuii TaxID=2817475 RepID=A0A975M6A7_9MICC|nr:hypothetical protein [Arthrobacter jiangjiafuii]MBP3045038.1 hypothetical protein [Arthrobacter jiangjiafuii]QWC10635.1 hypothetical protein KKR91_03090 [Arthrobacter jiangjiafuii]
MGLGILAGIIGLGPWVVTGMQLPLQNLWADMTLPEDMPRAALPLSQYLGITLVALLVTGGLIAGLAVRWWAPARQGHALLCAAAGLLLVQMAATVQSFGVLETGLGAGSLSQLYLGGLLAGVLASIAVALLVVVLVGSRKPALVTLGISGAAVPAGIWLLEWANAPFSINGLPPALYLIDNWFPALLIGAALAWCGAGTAGRAAVWVASLGILWLLPPLFDGVSYALGSRVLRGDLAQMLQAASDAFALSIGGREVWLPVLAAVVIGVVGALVLQRAPGRGAAEANHSQDRKGLA